MSVVVSGFTHGLPLRDRLCFPCTVELISICLGGWRKPENAEETSANMGKLHTDCNLSSGVNPGP